MNWTEDNWEDAVHVDQKQRDRWIEEMKHNEEIVFQSTGDTVIIKIVDELGGVEIIDCKVRRRIVGDPT